MPSTVSTPTIAERLHELPWPDLLGSLDRNGHAITAPVLTADECDDLIAMYAQEPRFRSRVDMARHRFGVGDYKYFAAPLPPLVLDLREHLYPPLAVAANRWMAALDVEARFPSTLNAFLERCATASQTRPTPLLLHYEAGGYNCLHQDIYGDVAFPLQVVAFLSRPHADYEGGEFLLVEQRPRAQSKGEAIRGERGALLVFTTRERPVHGARGYHRVQVRHGVSTIRRGTRYTLGIIFHDAR
jgi:hypothetical protein